MAKRGVESKEEYFSKLGNAIKQSFRFRKGLTTALLDIILSVLIISIIVFAVLLLISSAIDKLPAAGGFAGVLAGQGLNQLAAQVLPLVLLIILISLLAGFLLYGFFKGLIWKKILEKEFTIKYCGKFLALIIIWALIGLIILLPISMLLGGQQITSLTQQPIISKNSIITTIIQLLIMHFFALSVFYLTKEDALFQGMGRAFKNGARLHLFILPYIYMLAISAIAIIIIYVIGVYAILPATGVSAAELQMIGFQALATGSFTQLLTTLLKVAIPFLAIMIIIGSFANAYLRIFYKEFVSRI